MKHLPLPLPLVLYSKNMFFFLAAVSQISILIFAEVIKQGKRRDDFFTALVPFLLAKEHILVHCQPIYVHVAVHMCVPLTAPNLHLYNPWFDFAKICFHRSTPSLFCFGDQLRSLFRFKRQEPRKCFDFLGPGNFSSDISINELFDHLMPEPRQQWMQFVFYNLEHNRRLDFNRYKCKSAKTEVLSNEISTT